MSDSNDVRAGRHDLVGLKMASLTPQLPLPVLPHGNDNGFSNFFSSFQDCRTANFDTHKTSNCW